MYPIGLDPAWSVADNNLNYVNSLKMKISVIIGVLHMTLGVFVKAGNAMFFGRWVELFFEFLPQLAFLLLLFGYMDFLIVYKWLQAWPDPSIAPSIITTMINMPLRMGKTVHSFLFRMIAAADSPCGAKSATPHKMCSRNGSS
jgi:V-type H+-transporting ATPase subunit a